MHRWKGAGGISIAGDTWGDDSGPLVILQHGGGQTRHAWKGAGEIWYSPEKVDGLVKSPTLEF